MTVLVSLQSIVEALRHYRQFRWLDVHASSVAEFANPGALQARRDGDRILIDVGADRLEAVLDDRGVVRFSLAEERGDPAVVALGVLLGTGMAAALARPRSGPESTLLGLLVGGLAGAFVASHVRAHPDPNRFMALSYDPASAGWRVYQGPWRQWTVDTLWPPPGVPLGATG